ncbi:hypothetical protein FRC07_003418 [Ceratobasidium sp. 392]|nr:hypothetical protein FRC07_003418 [Ceratobasidium sp. 392]
MSLIPQMVWHGEAVKRQYDYTIQIASGVLQAIIFAISAQLYDTALEWFEQGRSVAWSQLLLRSPLDDLCAIDHSLAEQLQDVANELQGSAVLQPSATAWPRDHDSQVGCVERRCRLMEEWERLIHQAQSMLDYNSVFIPKTAPQLVAAAQTRAIIAVLVTETTCGALVIRPRATEVEWLALKRLSYSKVLEARGHSISLSSGVLRGRPTFKASNHSNDNVLQMLWEDVVQPVLGFLGYHEVLPASQLPHITWCTTGPLSFLPLHAAGDYSKPGCSLIDYCISSYSPTIGALLKPPLDPCAYSGIAMVSQAFTPGRPPLPGTIREVDSIAKQAQHLHTTRLDGQSATRDSVMSAMEQHSWVHLACHASQSVTNPTTSAFHLHNGPLDLGTISRKRLKHADLAFLSACQTATGDKDLLEEAVHLAAGMLMAGYRTVIATRWSINDDDAPLVAQWFYEYMLKDGVPDSRKAAQGLHYAVNMLREKVGTTEYKRWAPFIHIGI